MSDRVVIDRRFNGSPDFGHGGYVCGMLGPTVDGPAEVTLRRPPPLATPLTVALAADGTGALADGPVPVADPAAVSQRQHHVLIVTSLWRSVAGLPRQAPGRGRRHRRARR